ncbi:MAG: Fe-S oxidoreductase [Paludibacter sp. 47-17]|nr:MAG: (Fe-S)-binding protein [Paludibacter sp.]OJX90857.1 MAG: Fe-S oxidoreductase [Paludibacter sp. 47-17]
MDVQLFVPCFIDQLYPQTAFNTMKLLESLGCRVHYNPDQTCCGQPAFNSGYWPEATRLAHKFMNDFKADMPVVSPSASCTGYIIHQYPKLLKNDREALAQHQLLETRIFELSDFILNILKVDQLSGAFPHKVTFHDACSALREYGIYEEPRKLLRMKKGLEIVEMPESDTCCGFGGTFAVKNTAISAAMAEKKVLNALSTGVRYIVSTEASCLMNINGYIAKHQLDIKGVHLADILVQ